MSLDSFILDILSESSLQIISNIAVGDFTATLCPRF
jgi:hypothetical protein